ncbi:hypothetical protein Tco_0271720 [Tanacetum coccineum]
MLFGRTTIAELGMTPSTMHSAMLYQSKIGLRVIMSEYQNMRRYEQEKRLKESLLEAPFQLFECFNLEEKVIINQRNNADVIAWQYSDMTGIPQTIKIRDEIFVTEHKLNENNKIMPVQQKKRGMAPEQSVAAEKEVEELKRAGILKETRYQTWVANTVMVKKSDGAWRMCVDFTHINKS